MTRVLRSSKLSAFRALGRLSVILTMEDVTCSTRTAGSPIVSPDTTGNDIGRKGNRFEKLEMSVTSNTSALCLK